MSALLYFALWAGFIFLMMRFGCGAHVMGHGQSDHGAGAADKSDRPQWTAPETDIDPVCRMSVRTDSAKSSVYGGTVYYFCSAEHRDAFEAEPERYVGRQAAAEPKLMEHQHG